MAPAPAELARSAGSQGTFHGPGSTHGDWKEAETELGLASVGGADDLFGHAPLLLSMTAEPFEYPRSDWPDNLVLVGPCAWDPPCGPPPWLDDLDGPIVLVTTSSELQDDGRLVQAALEALAEEPVAVVATLPAGDPGGVPAPANARVERFIPHAPLLDRAACAVTHGGMGATQKALGSREGARRVQEAFAAAGGPSAAADAFATRLLQRKRPQSLPS